MEHTQKSKILVRLLAVFEDEEVGGATLKASQATHHVRSSPGQTEKERERVYRYEKLQAETETDAYVSVIIFFSAAGEVSAGNSLRYLAITPATWGAAMDVPNTQNKKIKYGLSNCEY